MGGAQRHLELGLASGRAQVWRRDHARVADERVVRITHRLVHEDVQRRAGDVPALQRGQQGILVDEAAARAVDDVRAGRQHGQGAGVDQAARLVGQRRVDGQDVGLRQHVVQGRA